MKKIIAIAGHARSGKDSLYSILEKHYAKQGLICKRFAFADELKYEVDEFLTAKVGVSAWTSDNVEKAMIRPFLVFWGTEFRRGQNADYWIECMKNSENWRDSNADVHIITDLRFSNEYLWLKGLDATCIYLSRELANGELLQAPNEHERVNNAWLQDHADINFLWPTFDNLSELEEFTNNNLITKL